MKQKKKQSLAMRVREAFFPDMIVSSPDQIDYSGLASAGYKIILLDIDNTLVRHGTRQGDDYAGSVIQQIREAGLLPMLASNARHDRAHSFASSLEIAYVAQAKKPDARAICRDLEEKGCLPSQAVMVGDQLLTDVLSARRGGIPVILTDRRSRKEIFTVRAKRILEWILIRLGGKEDFEGLRQVSIDQLTGGV